MRDEPRRPAASGTSLGFCPGGVLPPCGRCGELLWQVDARNAGTWVVLGPADGAPLSDLLPRR